MTDTNQASEDMVDDFYSLPPTYRTKENLRDYIRTEKLKLLTEVRERVVGEDVPEFHDPGCYQYNGLEYCHCSAKPDKAANKLRSEQRIELTKLEAELSQTLKEHKD